MLGAMRYGAMTVSGRARETSAVTTILKAVAVHSAVLASMPPYEFSVSVRPRYLADHSNPDERHFVFAYTVTIRNTGARTAKLVSRHWIITDGNNVVEEVRGDGVVGEQPVLAPGESFEYTSGCPLGTPVGSMRGSYQCVAEDGTAFEAFIPEFVLSTPAALH
jgi:ApaG protein